METLISFSDLEINSNSLRFGGDLEGHGSWGRACHVISQKMKFFIKYKFALKL